MKKEVDRVQATPSKRLFLSIIADYDLPRSICELIDNGLDVWVRAGRKAGIIIDVTLDQDQQRICVKDNAGGVPRSELKNIVGPGQTGSSPTDETIGIFGVGTKRAVVALSQDIRISTRHRSEKTFQIDFDETWLTDEDWDLPLYEVTSIDPGTTLVELQRLRLAITDEAIAQLRQHLSATYARFLRDQSVCIRLNGIRLKPSFFDNWAYPPQFEPRRYTGNLATAEGRTIKVEAIAGLSDESSPATGEYGVYFYCNDRLIARGLKTFEVGFMKGYAGLPHPKVSLTKVVISLNGDAGLMPWNSSKSDISTKHEVFQALHGWLNEVVKDYARLSRIWMGDWPNKVFRHKTGQIVDVPNTHFPTARRSFLPPAPQSRPRFADVVTHANQGVAKKKPWVRGLFEGVIAANLIARLHLEQRNRISLIVLDSTLEIAFKEYLVNDSGTHYKDSQLLTIFSSRHQVHTEMKKYVHLSADLWKKIGHFSNLRNKLIHQRATAGISDRELADFNEVVQIVLKKMYKLKFSA